MISLNPIFLGSKTFLPLKSGSPSTPRELSPQAYTSSESVIAKL